MRTVHVALRPIADRDLKPQTVDPVTRWPSRVPLVHPE